MVSSPRARSLRWLAPVLVAAVIGMIGLIPTLSSAATPDLAPLTPQQLLAKVQQAHVEAFSGTFQLTTNLGIPNLSAVQGSMESAGFNPLTLLSGTHEAHIKVDGPERQQLSMPGALSEVDVYHDGQNAWTWQSEGQKVTHLVLPARQADKPEAQPEAPPLPAPTPDQLAKQLLDQITPSTAASVTTPDYVADQAVYELVLAPHSADSTIDHAAIAVDANNGFPLQVSVFAKGQEKAALQLGFSSISYAKPSGPFTFTPPPGATVTTKDLTKGHDGKAPGQPETTPDKPAGTPDQGSAATTVVGQDWTQVVIARDVQLPGRQFGLREATTPVSGAFGTGRMLHTSLGNVLFLSDGRVAAGFVTERALEAAVPHA